MEAQEYEWKICNHKYDKVSISDTSLGIKESSEVIAIIGHYARVGSVEEPKREGAQTAAAPVRLVDPAALARWLCEAAREAGQARRLARDRCCGG